MRTFYSVVVTLLAASPSFGLAIDSPESATKLALEATPQTLDPSTIICKRATYYEIVCSGANQGRW